MRIQAGKNGLPARSLARVAGAAALLALLSGLLVYGAGTAMEGLFPALSDVEYGHGTPPDQVFLLAIWWITGGPGTFPWFVFILFGWGIAIVGHYVSVFRGHSYVDRKAEEEYQRLKKEQEGR